MGKRQSNASLSHRANNDYRRLILCLVWVTLLLSVRETEAFSRPKQKLHSHPGPISEFSALFGQNSLREQLHATKLFYRDGNDDRGTGIDSKAQSKATKSVRAKISSWWNGSLAPSPDVPLDAGARQEEIDRYLEFLDKRYHRLHDETPEPKKKQPKEEQKFSMLDWLSADNHFEHAGETRKENDALYVLGVAGLASERLLMKHHLIEPSMRKTEGAENGEVVIDTKATPEVAVRKVVQISSVMLRQLSHRRRTMIRYQNVQMRNALRLSAKTVVETPVRALKAVWEIGGGKRTFALTVAMLTAAFLLVRPVVAAIIETTLYQNPSVA